MNAKSNKPKCRHCGQFFTPDYRNRHHQYYCSDPGCRRVSKAASQRRWLRRAQNRDYFRGPEQTRRVQQWRKSNPGYWKKKSTTPQKPPAAEAQSVEQVQKSCNASNSLTRPLQDVWLVQHPVFIGLISAIVGSALQEDIATTLDQLQIQGRKILRQEPSDQCDSKRCINHGCQKHPSAEIPAVNFGQFWPTAINT